MKRLTSRPSSDSKLGGAPRRSARAMAFALLALAMTLCASSAGAQTNPLAEQLPADVWAYVSWGGTASLNSVSSTNSVARLWTDPGFSAFMARAIAGFAPGAEPNGLTPERVAQIFSALENQWVVGLISEPQESEAAGHNPFSAFLIYDATGKQDLVTMLRQEHDRRSPQAMKKSSIPVGDVTVEKRSYGTGATYQAQAGVYFISTDSLRAMEELIPRLEARNASGVSFTQAADFPAECQELARPSLLNVMVLPERFHIHQSQNSAFDLHAFFTSLHADRIRAACANVSFEKEIVRSRGVVLGDTSQGSLLNIFGDDRDSFTTMALAPAHSAFQVSGLSLTALYNSLFAAFSAAMPSDKAPFLAAGVAFLSSTWGMPPDQFFALFTGEIAVIKPNTTVDPTESVYAFTISDPQKVLHVLQHILPGEKATTSQQGDVSYLTVAAPAHSVGAAGDPPSAVYSAVMPGLLLASKNQQVLREAVARAHNAAGPASSGGLAADPDFQKARAFLPAKLISLNYVNYAHFNWEKLFAQMDETLNAQRQQQAARSGNQPTHVDIFEGLDPAILSRYLHVGIGGTWKDSKGIYFDSYVQ
jgi:hypothetical protein